MQRAGYSLRQIDLIGYHGHTVFHDPNQKISLQIGDPEKLSHKLQLPVVGHFRDKDIEHGGKGGPLAPFYMRCISKQARIIPAAFLQFSEVCNLIIINDDQEDLRSLSVCPFRSLFSQLLTERGGREANIYDYFGTIGFASQPIVEKLVANQEKLAHGRTLYAYEFSEDREDFVLAEFTPELMELSMQDSLATLEAFVIERIRESISTLRDERTFVPLDWFITAGSWTTPGLVARLTKGLKEELGPRFELKLAEHDGFLSNAFDPEIFSFLAVRGLRDLPATLPSTTGVEKPMTCGELFLPSNLGKSKVRDFLNPR